MAADRVRLVRAPLTRAALAAIADGQFGDMVKAVVDVRRGVMAVGGDMHADEEEALIEDGAVQGDLWGINLYQAERGEGWIEFDSMINVRPAAGNRSRDVEDARVRAEIRRIVATWVTDA